MPKLIVRPGDPLQVTRELDVFFIFAWLIYGGWGLAASIVGLPSVTETAGAVYNTLWSATIGVLGFTAAFACLSIFYKTRLNQIAKKRIELGAVTALSFFVAVYPVALSVQSFLSADFSPSVIISFLFLLVPVFRWRHLSLRIRNYERIAHDS